MGVPTSEVGYTSAMPKREEHEVRKDMWGHWGKNFVDIIRIIIKYFKIFYNNSNCIYGYTFVHLLDNKVF